VNQPAASASREKPPSFGLRVEEVTRSFGSVKALDQVSFDVPTKSIFGLVGPNGAGKTTLFSIIAGFLKPDGGKIEILDGLPPESPDLLGRVSILPQDALFDRNLSILDQLVFYRRLQGASRRVARDEVAAALTRVGLGSYSRAGSVGPLPWDGEEVRNRAGVSRVTGIDLPRRADGGIGSTECQADSRGDR